MCRINASARVFVYEDIDIGVLEIFMGVPPIMGSRPTMLTQRAAMMLCRLSSSCSRYAAFPAAYSGRAAGAYSWRNPFTDAQYTSLSVHLFQSARDPC